MFIKIIKGDIDKPNDMIIKVEDVLVLDIHSAIYTEYSITEDDRFIDYVLDNPNLEKCLYAQIHSHNNMNTFFSSTDMDELISNADKYPFYVSLIVNNNGDVCAKVASYAEEIKTTYTTTVLNKLGKPIKKSFSKTEKAVFVYDCEIHLENDVVLTPQIDACLKKNAEKNKLKTSFYNKNNVHNWGQNYFQDTQGSLISSLPQKTSKKESKQSKETVYSTSIRLLKDIFDIPHNNIIFQGLKECEEEYKSYPKQMMEILKDEARDCLYTLVAETLEESGVAIDSDEYFIQGLNIVKQMKATMNEYEKSFPTCYKVVEDGLNEIIQDYKTFTGEL
jgi:hypothetical protein